MDREYSKLNTLTLTHTHTKEREKIEIGTLVFFVVYNSCDFFFCWMLPPQSHASRKDARALGGELRTLLDKHLRCVICVVVGVVGFCMFVSALASVFELTCMEHDTYDAHDDHM